MKTPKVSVIIPTYNYGRFLDEAIRSVLDQTFSDYEVIIVDNASTDNTVEVVQKYLQDPRFYYHRNEKNLGLSGNFNKGLFYAKGDYIKFLNADDKFHPQLLEKFVAVMEKHPNVSLVTCDKQAFDESNKKYILPLHGLHAGEQIILNTLNDYNWIGEPTSVMYRRKDFTGSYSTKYTMYSDFDLWLRLLAIGDCYIIPEMLAYVRFHSSQLTNQLRRKKFITCFVEYSLCLDMQELNKSLKFTKEENLTKTTRKIATYCAKEGIKSLPKFYRRDDRSRLVEAIKIASNEGVFLSAFFASFKRARQIILSPISVSPVEIK